MIRYVCGFAFSPNRIDVAVILKNRPEFLAGKFNGIGGKIEHGEYVHDAMVREFKEEAGIDTEVTDWKVIGTLKFSQTFGKAIVYFFKADLTQEQFDAIDTQEDEVVHMVDPDELWRHMKMDAHARLYLLAALDDNVTNMDMEVI